MKFKVWFRKSFDPGYYASIQEASSADVLHKHWEGHPFFVGISKMDESDIPPVIREYRKECMK